MYMQYIEYFLFQESICLDNGSYLPNFAGCSQCGEKTSVVIQNRITTEDELDEEKITYQRKIIEALSCNQKQSKLVLAPTLFY